MQAGCVTCDRVVSHEDSQSLWRLLAFAAQQFGNGAVANVTVDLALHDGVPSMFRQSPENSERRPSPATSRIQGQAGSHEQKS
jgi:hypothetical protein